MSEMESHPLANLFPKLGPMTRHYPTAIRKSFVWPSLKLPASKSDMRNLLSSPRR